MNNALGILLWIISGILSNILIDKYSYEKTPIGTYIMISPICGPVMFIVALCVMAGARINK